MQTPAPREEPKLLDQVRDLIRLKHYSIRTEQAYLGWIKRFTLFHHKHHPKEMGKTEIEDFLTHLAVQENMAASTQNQAMNAILFLYRNVLKSGRRLAGGRYARQTTGSSACISLSITRSHRERRLPD